ncbi:thioesterase II family protein [Micromonospora sp. CNB394]|uniref:thioesterase II family protein n=1 Tax=Micromonospora sp. CNB394 TaxID=1169151 RepID=UPI000564D85F|nr:thioesterase domain-containing protein [Micromonospora sp. CNB394]
MAPEPRTAVPVRPGRWFVPAPPAGPLAFAFPYAGVGASSYRPWPARIGEVAVVAVQPPGRENRTREPAHRTHRAFAHDLADALLPYLDRDYYFVGHCGAVPYALETIFELERRGCPLPRRLVASSWGAPHRGLYGYLNFVDLSTADLHAETRLLFARAGVPVREDFVDLLTQVLRHDLETQRDYSYPAGARVPVPVTLLGWTGDDVVPADQVRPGWTECAQVEYEELEGAHLAFLSCPANLQRSLEHWLR